MRRSFCRQFWPFPIVIFQEKIQVIFFDFFGYRTQVSTNPRNNDKHTKTLFENEWCVTNLNFLQRSLTCCFFFCFFMLKFERILRSLELKFNIERDDSHMTSFFSSYFLNYSVTDFPFRMINSSQQIRWEKNCWVCKNYKKKISLII